MSQHELQDRPLLTTHLVVEDDVDIVEIVAEEIDILPLTHLLDLQTQMDHMGLMDLMIEEELTEDELELTLIALFQGILAGQLDLHELQPLQLHHRFHLQ